MGTAMFCLRLAIGFVLLATASAVRADDAVKWMDIPMTLSVESTWRAENAGKWGKIETAVKTDVIKLAGVKAEQIKLGDVTDAAGGKTKVVVKYELRSLDADKAGLEKITKEASLNAAFSKADSAVAAAATEVGLAGGVQVSSIESPKEMADASRVASALATPEGEASGGGECSGNGIKDTDSGVCVCDTSWFGEKCDQRQCSNHGHKVQDVCVCNPGYYGEDCSMKACNGHGKAGKQFCICDFGYEGPECNIECSNHGSVGPGGSHCVCDVEYAGKLCQTVKHRPTPTLPHKTKVAGTCEAEYLTTDFAGNRLRVNGETNTISSKGQLGLTLQPGGSTLSLNAYTSFGGPAGAMKMPGVKLKMISMPMPAIVHGVEKMEIGLGPDRIMSISHAVYTRNSKGEMSISCGSNPANGQSYMHWWIINNKLVVQRMNPKAIFDAATIKFSVLYTAQKKRTVKDAQETTPIAVKKTGTMTTVDISVKPQNFDMPDFLNSLATALSTALSTEITTTDFHMEDWGAGDSPAMTRVALKVLNSEGKPDSAEIVASLKAVKTKVIGYPIVTVYMPGSKLPSPKPVPGVTDSSGKMPAKSAGGAAGGKVPAVIKTQTVAEEKETLDAPMKALLTSASYAAKSKVVVETIMKGQAEGLLPAALKLLIPKSAELKAFLSATATEMAVQTTEAQLVSLVMKVIGAQVKDESAVLSANDVDNIILLTLIKCKEFGKPASNANDTACESKAQGCGSLGWSFKGGNKETCSATNGGKIGQECAAHSFADAEAKCSGAGASKIWWTRDTCRKSNMPGHTTMEHKVNASTGECRTSQDPMKASLVCCGDNDVTAPATAAKRTCALKKDETCSSDYDGATTTSASEGECQIWCEKQERGTGCQFEASSGICGVVKTCTADSRKPKVGVFAAKCEAGKVQGSRRRLI